MIHTVNSAVLYLIAVSADVLQLKPRPLLLEEML